MKIISITLLMMALCLTAVTATDFSINTSQLPYSTQDYIALGSDVENDTVAFWMGDSDGWLNTEPLQMLEGLSKNVEVNISVPLVDEGSYVKLLYFNTSSQPDNIMNLTYNFQILNDTLPPAFQAISQTEWLLEVYSNQLPYNATMSTDIFVNDPPVTIELTCGGFLICPEGILMLNDTSPYTLNITASLPEGIKGEYNDFAYLEKVGENSSNTTKLKFTYRIVEIPEQIRQAQGEYYDCLVSYIGSDSSNDTSTEKFARAEAYCWLTVVNKTQITNVTEKVYETVKVAAIDDEATDIVKNTSLGLQNVTNAMDALETDMKAMNTWMANEEERNNNTFTNFVNWVDREYSGKISHWWFTGTMALLATTGLGILIIKFLKRRREMRL